MKLLQNEQSALKLPSLLLSQIKDSVYIASSEVQAKIDSLDENSQEKPKSDE